jgi:hypothetical protein
MSTKLVRGVAMRFAKEFPNERALEQYLKQHPNADPKNHWVKPKSESKSKGSDDDSVSPKTREWLKKMKPGRKPNKGERFTSAELDLNPAARQKLSDPDALMAQAHEAHDIQLGWLNHGQGLDKQIGAEVYRCDKSGGCDPDYDKPGPIIIIGPVKKKERAQAKADVDADGDWGVLGDLVRASVGVDSFEEIDSVLDKLRDSGLKIARPPKDRFKNPTPGGYRDLMLNVEFPNGHIGELQLHVKPMLKAKETGHDLYDVVRKIEEAAIQEGRDTLTDDEWDTIDKANRDMKALYDKAWKSAGGKTAHVKMASKWEMFFDFNGLPVRWDKGKLPIATNYVGSRVPLKGLDRFFLQAMPISKSDFDKLVQAVTGGEGSKKKATGAPLDEWDGSATGDRGTSTFSDAEKPWIKGQFSRPNHSQLSQKFQRGELSGRAEQVLVARVIRLAHNHPQIRPYLLDALKTSGFDPDTIGQIYPGGSAEGVGGSDADKPWMDDEFTQQEFSELQDLED